MIVHLRLAGLSPLLCSRPARIDPTSPPETQAREKLYLDHELRPSIPNLNLVRCLLGAAGRLRLHAAELVHAIGVMHGLVPIRWERPWCVDTRLVRDLDTHARVPCHRPRFDEWALVFDLEVDEGLLSEATARELAEAAGRHVGLGDFRPERGGPFGRFQVDRWQVAATPGAPRSVAPLAAANH